MGMMDMAQMPQEAPAPQQGMMGGPASQDPALSHGKFNGQVSTTEGEVSVKAGIMTVKGKPYIVSDDGSMVLDYQGHLIGHIDDQKFIPVDSAYMDQMQKKGYIQS